LQARWMIYARNGWWRIDDLARFDRWRSPHVSSFAEVVWFSLSFVPSALLRVYNSTGIKFVGPRAKPVNWLAKLKNRDLSLGWRI
jgi:hypothetical protein